MRKVPEITVEFSSFSGSISGDPVSPYIFILCAEVLSLMLRKKESVKGIHINNKLFLLSQYADDTQIYLDGSESSLRSTLNILHKFYEMSGLKINKENPKALWIGSMSMSGLKLCQAFRLDWDQGSIKIIGVIFTSETFDIWDRNSKLLLNKVENLLSI